MNIKKFKGLQDLKLNMKKSKKKSMNCNKKTFFKNFSLVII